MIKEKIVVPKGIKYLSDWKDFRFNQFNKKCIIDKKLPGCGFTQYCLKGKENVILCSPRKILLENKKDKHGDEVYLVRNELEVTLNYDKNLTNKPDKAAVSLVVKNPTQEEQKKIYTKLYEEIENYISCTANRNKPYKIMVTYDSFHIVKDILEHLKLFQSFYIVIDEFQSILHDSKFKSDTEIKFLDHLQQSHSSLFVSATPMMEKYLDFLDEFNKLAYYELDWVTEDPERLIRPDLKVRTMKSVGTKCEEIIGKYKSGNFDKVRIIRGDRNTEEIESKEAVFYVNSVNHIINIINKCNLNPEEVNILCSDTDYNQRRLKQRLKIKNHKIGKVPKEGETNKMFTFCTRTVYLGADFYSKCAKTFVFSDANINTLVVDISEDLAQILGRQRDEDNPWCNSANFYYIPSNKSTEEEFNKNLKEKLNATEKLLSVYKKVDNEEQSVLAKNYEIVAKAFNYRDNYVAVNSNNTPVLNKLAMIAEKRAYEIQKYDYADRFSIFNKLKDQFGNEALEKDSELEELETKYNELTTMPDRLKFLCSISPDLMYKFINRYIPDSDKIKSIFLSLSQKRIIANGYNITRINKEILDQQAFKELSIKIYSVFKEGDHYSNSQISEIVQKIYDESGLDLKAKAIDIKRWFEVKLLKLQDKKANKRVGGIKLIRKL